MDIIKEIEIIIEDLNLITPEVIKIIDDIAALEKECEKIYEVFDEKKEDDGTGTGTNNTYTCIDNATNIIQAIKNFIKCSTQNSND